VLEPDLRQLDDENVAFRPILHKITYTNAIATPNMAQSKLINRNLNHSHSNQTTRSDGGESHFEQPFSVGELEITPCKYAGLLTGIDGIRGTIYCPVIRETTPRLATKVNQYPKKHAGWS